MAAKEEKGKIKNNRQLSLRQSLAISKTTSDHNHYLYLPNTNI